MHPSRAAGTGAARARAVVRRLLSGLVIFAALLSAWSYASAQRLEYTLGSGDKVRVNVFGQPDMSGEFSISGNGTVSLPFVGQVQADGLTVAQLEAVITEKLQPDYLKNPRVSVEVLNFRPFDIIGEVQKPGSYPYRNGMTITNAIAMAGGFTYRAREDDFYIVRAADPNHQEQPAGRETVVLPGDVIIVRERYW